MHGVLTSVNTTTVSSTKYVASVYAKANGRNFCALLDSQTGVGKYFDLVNGTVLGDYNASPPVAASITPVGSGWYRCSITITATTALRFRIYTSDTGSNASYAGDISKGIYLWGAQLSNSASLDAYSPVYGAAVTSAAYYAPRLDFDPVTLAARGLLVEELRTNVVPYSCELASWSDSGATVTSNAVIAPDGTLTADDLARSSSISDSRLQAVTFTGDGSKSFSVYVKYNTSPSFMLFVYDVTATAGRAQIEFGFTAGVPAATTTTSGSVEAIENVGGGWYRIKIIAAGVVAANTNRVYLYPARTGSADGQKTTFWGAQAENASFATSFIPTVGNTTATRTADVASVSTQAFPYSATESTLVAAFTNFDTDGSCVIAHLDGSVAGNGVLLFQPSGVTALRAYVAAANELLGTMTLGDIQKAGIAYNGANNGAVRNGGTVISVGTTYTEVVDRLLLGSNYAGTSSFINGHIRQITYIPRRITDAELQARTA